MITESKKLCVVQFLFIMGLLACGSVKNISQTSNNQAKYQPDNVILTVRKRIPYCGGAAPSHEQADRTAVQKNSEFVIQFQPGYGDSLWYKEFKTDSSGMIRLYLPHGKYCLKRAGKNIPFDDFYKMQKKESDAINLYKDKTCFYYWWKSCIEEFELNDSIKTTEKEVVINARCFTGENPCHIYRGPWPP